MLNAMPSTNREWIPPCTGRFCSPRWPARIQRHGCEACHGPGSRHIQDYTDRSAIITFGPGSPQPAVGQNAVCLQCHMKGQRLFWQGSAHELRDVSCVSCHSVHNAQTRHANLKAPSQLQLCSQCHAIKTAMALNWAHMPVREGKMQCADCHNVHGSLTEFSFGKTV